MDKLEKNKENKRKYTFSSEHVSPGHPDKLCDQISDACVNAIYDINPSSDTRIAIETMIKGNVVILAGEVSINNNNYSSNDVKIDYEYIVKRVLRKNYYTKAISPQFNDENVVVVNLISQQSNDIAQCVNRNEHKSLGAGDQGIMFGFAFNEAPDSTGWCHYIARYIVFRLYEKFIKQDNCKIYKPDFKVQVTCDYINDKVVLKLINVSISHNKDVNIIDIRNEIEKFVRIEMKLIEAYNDLDDIYVEYPNFDDYTVLVNQNGPFTIFGPVADCGLTGRKIVCDQYGGYAPVGGGAFSGKDLTKIDRTAAYMSRLISSYFLKFFLKKSSIDDKIKKIRTVQTNVSYIIGEETANNISIILTFDDGTKKYIDCDNDYDLYELFNVENMYQFFQNSNREIDFENLSAMCHYGHFSGTELFKN